MGMYKLLNKRKGFIMNNDNNSPKDAQNLVGTKVNMTVTEHESTMGDKVFKYKEYEIVDPNFEKKVNSINPDNRIFPPNTAGTMDYKPFRLNVYIDESGIVTEVSNG